jgi:hypothetical protein
VIAQQGCNGAASQNIAEINGAQASSENSGPRPACLT